jgi:hypothetical protein
LGNLADGTLVAVDGYGLFGQIDRTTGATTLIGDTGLGISVTVFASLLNGELFAMDSDNVLYRIDPATGATTRVGATGLPAMLVNGGGSNALAGDARSLYYIFEQAITHNPSTLYKIDTTTGRATAVGKTGTKGLGGAGFADGTLYAYDGNTNRIDTIDLATGKATAGSTFSTGFAVFGSNSGQAVAEPVAVTGYSADVISDKDPTARFAQPFNAGTFAWFEAGAVDDAGVPHHDGLPAGLTFTSATGSGATYQIQVAHANSVLQLSAGQTGTLTLTTPAAYSTLYVIASSGDGTSSSVGSGNIHFVDGSTQAFSYNCFDWCNGQSVLDQINLPPWTGAATNIALGNQMGQTFTPGLPILWGVDIDIETGNNHGDDTITLEVAKDGNVLSTTSQFVHQGFDGLLHFDLPSPLMVDVGQSYTLWVQDTGKVTFFWKYGEDRYRGGTSIFGGKANSQFDFRFQTYGGQGGLHPEAVLQGLIGRADVSPSGTAFTYNQDCHFQIYETVLAIDPSHAGVAVTSIDFTGAPDAYFSNVFGVSAK